MTVERLLGLAALAPSVGLSEPWRFVLVESADRRAAIFGAAQRHPSGGMGNRSPKPMAISLETVII